MPKANGQPTRAERSAANKAAFAAKRNAPRVRSAAPDLVVTRPARVAPTPVAHQRSAGGAERICQLAREARHVLSMCPEGGSRAESRKCARRLRPIVEGLYAQLRAEGYEYTGWHGFAKGTPCDGGQAHHDAGQWVHDYDESGQH